MRGFMKGVLFFILFMGLIVLAHKATASPHNPDRVCLAQIYILKQLINHLLEE